MAAMQRGIGRGWRHLLHTKGWRMNAAGVAASFLLLQLLLIALPCMWHLSQTVLERSAVRVDIVAGTSDQNVQELYAALQRIPAASSVTLMPKEQVLLEEQERDPSLAEFLASTGIENPFSDTFVVQLQDSDGYEDLRAFVQDAQWQDVIDPITLSDITAQEAAASNMLEAVEIAHVGTAFLAIVAVIVALILSASFTIGLGRACAAVRRIARLGGASAEVEAMPVFAAAATALLGAVVVASILAAACVAVLPLLSGSDALSSFLSQAVLGAVPVLIVFLFLEVVVLSGTAWVVARSDAAIVRS